MRAAVFIRYHGADELGHVGWAFDFDPVGVNSGSVENHRGSFFAPNAADDFWTEFSGDPVAIMRARGYDDAKYVDLEAADPLCAYRVVLWVQTQAYKAAHRNCEDDAYDVLRAFGVKNLPAPVFHWFPKRFFALFNGTLAHLPTFAWPKAATVQTGGSSIETPDLQALTPLRPQWRQPWSLDFHILNMRRLMQSIGALFHKRAGPTS
jgi:hypothetical protein